MEDDGTLFETIWVLSRRWYRMFEYVFTWQSSYKLFVCGILFHMIKFTVKKIYLN